MFRKAERYSIGKFPHGGNSPIQFTFAQRTYLIEDISYSYIAFAKRIYRVYFTFFCLNKCIPRSQKMYHNLDISSAVWYNGKCQTKINKAS